MTSNNKLISCIMANYNTEKDILKDAIDSILNQTYTDFELIIVDDASTNESYQLIEEYAAVDSRIVVLRNNQNRGLAYSLNRAIDVAKGEYIARMDTDDIAIKDRFFIQYEYMESNTNIDVCGTFAKIFGDQNYYSLSPLITPEYIRCQLLFVPVLIHPTVMFRSEFLKKYNLRYDETYKTAQDYELWNRIAHIANISIVDKFLLKYRVHSKQISVAKYELQRENAIKISRRSMDLLGIEQKDIDIMSHLILCGKEHFTEGNIRALNKWCEYIRKQNKIYKIYNENILDKVLNNRVFNIILKANMNGSTKIKVLLQNNKYLTLFNAYTLIYRVWKKTFSK